jgi:hypothetical protein
MTTPDSRQPASRKIARTALAMLSTVLPMSAVVFQRKQARYWQALPVRSMAGVLAALFFTVSAWGFFLDLIEWKRLPLWALLISASLYGVTGVVSFVTVRRRVFKLIPVLIILGIAAGYVPDRLPRGPHILLSDAAASGSHSMPSASCQPQFWDTGRSFFSSLPKAWSKCGRGPSWTLPTACSRCSFP